MSSNSNDSDLDGDLLFSREFEEHMDNDIQLLKECAVIAYNHVSDHMSKWLNKAEKYKLQYARQLYIVAFFIVSLVISQYIQNNQNTKLLKHIEYLEHQILVNNLQIDNEEIGENCSIERIGMSSSDLFRIINGFYAESKSSALEVHLNAGINVKDRTYLLNKRINSEGFLKAADYKEVNSQTGNRLIFNSEWIMNSVRWSSGISLMNITKIEDLDNLKTTMNVRLPGSPIEYKLHIRLNLDILNVTRP